MIKKGIFGAFLLRTCYLWNHLFLQECQAHSQHYLWDKSTKKDKDRTAQNCIQIK